MRKLTILGVEHFKTDYNQLMSCIYKINPDALFIEEPSPKKALEYYGYSLSSLLTGEQFSKEILASINYSKFFNRPIYCVDKLNLMGHLIVPILKGRFKFNGILINYISKLREFVMAKTIENVSFENGLLIVGKAHVSGVAKYLKGMEVISSYL